MICSWCKGGDATHIGYGSDPDGRACVLCDGCAERAERLMSATVETKGGEPLAYGLCATVGFVMGLVYAWWWAIVPLGRW